MYFPFPLTACIRTSAHVIIVLICASSLIFGRIISKFAGNNNGLFQVTLATYLFCSRAARACESAQTRACESAHVLSTRACVRVLVISGHILSKHGGNIRSYMSYFISVWMHVPTARTSITSRIVHRWCPNVANPLTGKDCRYSTFIYNIYK
jgi:hypothetical protein